MVAGSLGATALCLLFLGPPLVALVVTIYGVLFSSGGDVPTVRFAAGSTAVLLAGMVGLYLLPITLTTYGREESLRSSLSLASIREVGTHGGYFVGWTIGCVAFSLAASVGSVLFTVPRLGPLLGTLPLAYGLLVTANFWGRAVARSR